MKLYNNLKYTYLIVKDRLSKESPLFFQRLKAHCIKVGGSALAVIAINTSMSLGLPVGLITVLGYVVAVCAAIAGTSQLTKQD